MSLFHDLAATLWSTLHDVTPIVVTIAGFQLFVIRKPIPHFRRVAIGFVFVLLGLTLFLLGLERGLFPLGKLMAEQLTAPRFVAGAGAVTGEVDWRGFFWVYLFAFAIGFSTTIAEPALYAVAAKASEVSGGAIGINGLRIAVALGVAFGIALGAWRIVTGAPLHWFIIAGYIVVIIQTAFAPRMIIGLAYDSGGVTTSTVTVPLVAALGLGLAANVPGRSPLLDGFGLIAFASLFPIIAVLGYAQISQWWDSRSRRSVAEGEG